jgi:hypothetical protein
MSKIVSVLCVCAAIAGVSAYAMYGNPDTNRGCDGCRVGHVAATVETGCGHSHDEDSTSCESSPCCASKVSAKAAKADCCAPSAPCCPSACCPGACCNDAILAVAGGPAAATTVKVSTPVKAAKAGCCDDSKAVSKVAAKADCCAAGAACCPGACCDDAIDCVACCGTAKAAVKAAK